MQEIITHLRYTLKRTYNLIYFFTLDSVEFQIMLSPTVLRSSMRLSLCSSAIFTVHFNVIGRADLFGFS